MVQREWVEKDFYKVLGVSSDASEDEIKRVARKLLAENHPDRNPDNKVADERYKEVGEARDVLTDPAKRKEYDETRRLFAGGGGFGRRFNGGGGAATTPSTTTAAAGSTSTTCSARPVRTAGPTSATCSAGCSEGRAARAQSAAPRQGPRDRNRPRLPRGDQRVSPCRCGSPARRRAPTATAAGAPGTSPKVCATCNGSG